ncbi:MAG: transcription antitermination factor NusB [Candidatus Omnitrophica bacterium]|nr:transcription antitermination factor NusB [Candidatus Omnitrophota bacterium]
MRRRTKARECALKILYAVDITKNGSKDCIKNFWDNHDTINVEIKKFADYLVMGTYKNKDLIDNLISKAATNWQIQRMATIDRNIIRMATFELLFAEDIPPKVSINEAIEIAKKYGDKDSNKFVNGVLDRINKQESKK